MLEKFFLRDPVAPAGAGGQSGTGEQQAAAGGAVNNAPSSLDWRRSSAADWANYAAVIEPLNALVAT